MGTGKPATAGGGLDPDDDGTPPPLFKLAVSNGLGDSSSSSHTPGSTTTGLDKAAVTTPPAGHDPGDEQPVDLSRAGVLLGRIDTPALACYTEHGAVPYLTRGEWGGWLACVSGRSSSAELVALQPRLVSVHAH